MTAPVYWARIGERLDTLVTETDVPVQGDSILSNLFQLPMPDGQLWDRVGESGRVSS